MTNEGEGSATESRLISTKEAAHILGVSQRWVIHLLNQGDLDGQLLSRQWIVYQESVERYKQAKKEKGQKDSSKGQ